MDIPTKDSPTSEILSYLRRQPEYQVSMIVDGELHPFHRRYHAKPEIYNAFATDLHLCKFVHGGIVAEFLEIQDAGLTSRCIVMIPATGKQLEFKTVLEAECFIADVIR